MGSRWLDTGEWSREWKGGHLGPVTPCLHKRLAKVWDSSRRPQSMGMGESTHRLEELRGTPKAWGGGRVCNSRVGHRCHILQVPLRARACVTA